jgi:TolB-like protein/Tfp pilus assembly protein PilF/predicted Ser/Thr protein kinase
MALQAGERLGPYEILAPIGAGGMGEVYKAHDPRLGRDVAIKVTAQQFSDRFEREARAIAALNHSNICQVYDIGPNYLVMEFIEGTALAGPVPLDVALRHAVQIADALSAAHAKGITHRDLKPANILVTASGVKLLDFGLALMNCGSVADETVAMSPTQVGGRTEAGTILDTAAYMSPEQAEAKPVDARSDIFSFGLVLYEVLSGRRAFKGDSAIAIMAAIVRDQPEPLEAPPPVESIVARCLRKSPADRFQSLTEVKDALLAASRSVSSPGAAVSGTPTAQPQSSSAERRPSIAVLPFANLGGDKENEYFSDGLGEEIINVLARIPNLKVIARTSAFAFRGKELDIRKIAEMLGVRTVLEGSVRRAGSRIRVTAQLITAEDGSHLWSERYDRELADVFALQDEIAEAIATALTTKLALKPEVSRQHTPVLAAYEAVLRARHHLNKVTPESMERARECLQQAIAIDPGYALPHSVLGGCFLSPAVYGMLPAHQAMPLARAEYQKALEIDPMLPEALVGLAAISMLYDYDWNEAKRLFEMAMRRGPLPGGARMRYGHYLFCTGRTEDAMRESESAVQGDPLNLQLRSILALEMMIAGRAADAAGECRRILELDENYYLGHFYLSLAYGQLGQIEKALVSAEMAYSLAPWARAGTGNLAGLLKLSGDTGRAEAVRETLGDGTAPGARIGFIHYHLICSEIEQAADWAEKAIAQREPAVIYYLLIPHAKDLWRSSRWPALAKMMNLPRTVA